jgi:hypothetical protein
MKVAKSSSKSGGRKERITPPKTRLLSREGAKLRRGDPAAARILAEESVAVRQGVRKSKPKR